MKDFLQGETRALGKRKLSDETCAKFGYTVGKDKSGTVQIAPYYNEDRQLVAQKVRGADKAFYAVGSLKEAQLFGQHLWTPGKKIVITEGEIDCMSVSQVQNNKWPVVSVPNGAQGAKKAIAKQLPWLNQFEEIILMFDMDDPGQEAARECALLFEHGKAKVGKLPLKDPNECLKEGKVDAIIHAIWNAEAYRPDGIVTFESLMDDIRKPVEVGIPWWDERLTDLTYGRRYGELYGFGAGTGIGKTDWFTQAIMHDVSVLNEPVGLFYLEQSAKETATRLTGKFADKRFHVPSANAGWTQDELNAALDSFPKDRVFLYDSFGSSDWDVIKDTIEYLCHYNGVKLFYLDHLTALCSHAEDERRFLDGLMEEVASLCQRLGIIIHFISHLTTPEGTPHEEGGRVMARHFRGSRAIQQWAFFLFGLERNQQADDPEERTVTAFRVLKDRYTGQSNGSVIHYGYEVDSGSLFARGPFEEAPFTDETQTTNEGY